MNKPTTPLLVLMIVVAFVTADVFAQGGRGQGRQGGQQKGGQQARGQQGNQQSQGQQRGRGQNGQTGQGNGNGNQQNAGNALSAMEQQGLILLREEEKLARDVYTALHAKWGEQVFANISRAESQHMGAVGNLLSKYGIPDPVKNNAAGVFTSPTFQQLYATCINTGSKSLQDALKVGLKIEEMDIADLRVAIKATSNQDIQRVLGNLLRGSHNHLRAFAARLNAAGGTYVATSLSQADFNQIASSGQETGGGNGQSNGNRKGQSGKNQSGKSQGRQMGKGNAGGQGKQQRRGKGRGNGR